MTWGIVVYLCKFVCTPVCRICIFILYSFAFSSIPLLPAKEVMTTNRKSGKHLKPG